VELRTGVVEELKGMSCCAGRGATRRVVRDVAATHVRADLRWCRKSKGIVI
jgi:hypothetical protein